ncbi:hypothetical protein JL100_021210 [Skermanella mucosa]|uniref:hypothetical protein n=1 Tax=Skermanella mucosa TaxID=1789672 RepID=UPI00192CA861|nr:hypothetical protein [Skermanella mucosa]UEM19589.1 hypothetical protein JL100_021210 [Skermanella mucosa]
MAAELFAAEVRLGPAVGSRLRAGAVRVNHGAGHGASIFAKGTVIGMDVSR